MFIHHITLFTKDLNLNRQFYETILGLRFVKNSVNQENPKTRHVYYSDYPGTPGNVITFIQLPFLGHRYDEDSYIQGIDYYAPNGSQQFWQDRFDLHNISYTIKDQRLFFKDYDDVELSLTFIDESLPEKLVNSLSDVPAEFQLLRFKNANIYINDFAAETNFFETLTGITIENNQLLLEHQQSITLKPTTHPGKKRFGRGSVDHIALSAVDIDDIHRIRSLGETAGFEFEKETDRLYFYSIYFKDPHHNRIEFATLAPGFAIDEPLESLGQTLGLPERLEPRRAELTAFYADQGITFMKPNKKAD